MKPAPDDMEFECLALRWLDRAASEDEARLLWAAVAADPARARQLASLARFDTLLSTTLHTRHRAADAIRLAVRSDPPPAPVKAPKKFTPPVWKPLALGLAAALVLLAGIGWMLESGAPDHPGLAGSRAKESSRPEHMPASATAPPLPKPPVPAAGTEQARRELAAFLDAFYLTHVELDAVPLGRALGLLQGQMRQLDRAFLASGMRVTVPADAAMRKVSLTSGPISFLKAVRTLAALAGCSVEVDAEKVALTLQKDIFPQPATMRDLLDVLAGRWTQEGRPASEDEASLAGLLADAASLGISVDAGQPGWNRARITHGQLAALGHLTEARHALAQMPAPAFHLFVAEAPAGPSTENSARALTQREAEALIAGGGFNGPVSEITTPLLGTQAADARQPLLSFSPSGTGREISLSGNPSAQSQTGGGSMQPFNSAEPLLLSTGGGVFVGEDGALYQSAGTEPQTLLLIPASNNPTPTPP